MRVDKHRNFERIKFYIEVNFMKGLIIDDEFITISVLQKITKNNLFNGKFFITFEDEIDFYFEDYVKYGKEFLESLKKIKNEEKWEVISIPYSKIRNFIKTYNENSVFVTMEKQEIELNSRKFRYCIRFYENNETDKPVIEIRFLDDDNLNKMDDIIYIFDLIIRNYEKIIEFIKSEIKRIIVENKEELKQFLFDLTESILDANIKYEDTDYL
jgi:predicted transcriptional regulator